MNAQAELFANGAVNICYGAGRIGNNFGFAAGIEGGGENDPYWTEGRVAYPLPEPYFNSEGITRQWPANKCYCFNPSEMDLQSPPASSN